MSVCYPFRLIKIDDRGHHPFITFFHGKKSYNALIDCGASQSFLNTEFFEENFKKDTPLLSIGMGSGFSIWVTTLNMIDLSGMNFVNIMLLKTNLSYINQSLSSLGFAHVDGIFGCDLLQLLEAKIDFEHRQLFFHGTKQSHPLILEGDSFFTISITLNNKLLRFLLDTGASQTLLDVSVADLLFPDIFTDWKINNGQSIGISPNDIANTNRPMTIAFDNSCTNDVPRWKICFTDIKMNKVNHAYQSIGLHPVDAILGIDFLNKFCKYLDFNNFNFQLKKPYLCFAIK